MKLPAASVQLPAKSIQFLAAGLGIRTFIAGSWKPEAGS
jgi:hypothetical protein